MQDQDRFSGETPALVFPQAQSTWWIGFYFAAALPERLIQQLVHLVLLSSFVNLPTITCFAFKLHSVWHFKVVHSELIFLKEKKKNDVFTKAGKVCSLVSSYVHNNSCSSENFQCNCGFKNSLIICSYTSFEDHFWALGTKHLAIEPGWILTNQWLRFGIDEWMAPLLVHESANCLKIDHNWSKL